jgi:hypothetical protein
MKRGWMTGWSGCKWMMMIVVVGVVGRKEEGVE